LPVVDDSSDLAAKLREVSINNEILVAVSNKNLAASGFMLDMWIRSVQARGAARPPQFPPPPPQLLVFSLVSRPADITLARLPLVPAACATTS